MNSDPSIVPYFSYVDAVAALDFLQRAFAFEVVQAFKGEDGKIIHAEMRHGNGVIMMGTIEARASTQSPGTYVVVTDVDAHFARATDAGVSVVYPPEDTDFGTRRYRCRDPEGHEWTFGTYQPRTEPPSWT